MNMADNLKDRRGRKEKLPSKSNQIIMIFREEGTKS